MNFKISVGGNCPVAHPLLAGLICSDDGVELHAKPLMRFQMSFSHQ